VERLKKLFSFIKVKAKETLCQLKTWAPRKKRQNELQVVSQKKVPSVSLRAI